MSLFQSKLTRYLAISSAKKTNHSSDYMEIEEEDGQNFKSRFFEDKPSKVNALSIKKQMKNRLLFQYIKRATAQKSLIKLDSDSQSESSERSDSCLEAPEFRRHYKNLPIKFANEQAHSIVSSEEEELNLAFSNQLSFESESKKDLSNRRTFFNSMYKERKTVFNNTNTSPAKVSTKKITESTMSPSIEAQKSEPRKTRQKNKKQAEPSQQLTISQKIQQGVIDEKSQMRLGKSYEYSIFYKGKAYWFPSEEISKLNPRWIVQFYAQRGEIQQ